MPATKIVERFLTAAGLTRPELRAWALYDWANSAVVLTIVTALFPIYYATVASAGTSAPMATVHFARTTSLALAVIAITGPVLGAIADVTGRRKHFLGAFLALGVLGVGGMFFITAGQWILASVLFGITTVGLNGSFVFYDALLPHVARDDEIDRVSTAGYALGYLGSGLLMAVQLAWILRPGWFGFPSGQSLTPAERTLPVRIAFVTVAIWWAVFSIPLFRRVPEPPATRARSSRARRNAIRTALHGLRTTLSHLRGYRSAFLMLLAFLIYNDGIGTIIRMASLYGQQLGIGSGALIGAILLVQFVGIPFAFLFGRLARRIGAKRSIFVGLAMYVLISVVGYFMRTATHFFILAFLVGTVQGGTQALSRSLFASMIPRADSGEFFGFFAVCDKFAGIFGPLLYGETVLHTGSSRSGILSVIAFFLVGAAVLAFVDVDAGQAAVAVDAAPPVSV
ncbi:MAG TPA: MFS transporter [Gemmatimonadaceae bacterium]|nr:MFS transporter [Gemmatimonadaceae bacterium]